MLAALLSLIRPATLVAPAVTKRLAAGAQAFSACLDGIARYLAHRDAIATLHALDDQALRDIGLARSQIEDAVHGFVTLPKRGRV